METERVIVGNPIVISGTTVVPVVKLYFNCQPSCGGIFFSGVKKPVSVVVSSPSTKKAFAVTGEEIPLDQLIKEAPGLAEILEKS